ncbi:restriction endonuclease [Roseomonas sp. BN140053]|uniref:restriction endonuclease n=1 Tax=Roseomonas sp. BN140053 TaxID=3391898 RepID=UPI0039EB92DC
MSRRHQRRAARDERRADPLPPPADEICVLCRRPIPAEARSSRHHLTPRLKGGTHLGTVRLHQLCHSAIHARFTEAELARHLAEPEALRAAPELAGFLHWVGSKPPGFHAPTRAAKSRTGKWR